MPVDPTDPDTFDEDETTEIDTEAPEADTREQLMSVAQQQDDTLTGGDPDAANEADRAEQARVVELDEDDYR
ncbi:hypothetical protein ABT381_34375 [Streptomyces sp. NPDC000151]|uniref:hypothetical protein n=1 Tax=Streptomyces sp. NPDC000151 TaxID=3154244 RepID=UPI003317C778